jgi:hypothetical protein
VVASGGRNDNLLAWIFEDEVGLQIAIQSFLDYLTRKGSVERNCIVFVFGVD